MNCIVYFRIASRRGIKGLRLTIPRCAWNLNLTSKSFFTERGKPKKALELLAEKSSKMYDREDLKFSTTSGWYTSKHVQSLSCLRQTFPRTWLRISSLFPISMSRDTSSRTTKFKGPGLYGRFKREGNINRELIDKFRQS